MKPNRKQTSRRKSILYKILLPMAAVLLFQSILFYTDIEYGGTVSLLRQNRLDILNEQVINRKNYLENNMRQHWGNISDFNRRISNSVDTYLNQHSYRYQDMDEILQISELLGSVDQSLIDMLRYTQANGAYIILNKPDDNGNLPGLYVHDNDPQASPSDNSDLMFSVAPGSIVKKQGIPMDTLWSARFEVNQLSTTDFYEKPLAAAKSYPDLNLEDLGYWSTPFQIHEGDESLISYTQPLIGADGTIYGVVGSSVRLSYLESLLPYEELSDHHSAYLLALQDKQTFHHVSSAGSEYKNKIGEGADMLVEDTPYYNNIYKLKDNEHMDGEEYACVEKLRLYNVNTPFSSDNWTLSGVASGAELFSFSNEIRSTLLISISITFIIGLIALILAAKRITSPIAKLASQVNSSNREELPDLHKTGIGEIDDLTSSIEQLSRSVANSASRFSRIVDMLEMPIGAFEVVHAEKLVFCTNAFYRLLGIEKHDKTYLSLDEFKSIMKPLNKGKDQDMHNVFRIQINQQKRWIRIRTSEEEGRTLGVMIDVTQDMQERSRIMYERDHDLLTGLLNRRAFLDYTKYHAAGDELKIGAMMFWDLDNLKYVNDTYGHDYGDRYLIKAAEILSQFEAHHAIVARMSGDEFFVFLYQCESKAEATSIIQAIRAQMQEAAIELPDGEQLKIQVSMGLSWYPDDSRDFDELMRYADFAMYQVKNTTKGYYAQFDREHYRRDLFLFQGVEEFDEILNTQNVKYALQPIVDVNSMEIFAYEALMRPQGRMFKTPQDIIRMAQMHSKLDMVEHLTWFKALEVFEQQLQGDTKTRLFVNSIPNISLNDEDLTKLVQRYRPYLGRLVMEIIESEEINDNYMRRKMDFIKTWNAQIALDDYGTGYSGDLTILTYHPSFVKIDMSIIRNIHIDKSRHQLVEMLLAFAKSQNIKLIAEGIETFEELEAVMEMGIDYVQGYFISKPKFTCDPLDQAVLKAMQDIRDNINNK